MIRLVCGTGVQTHDLSDISLHWLPLDQDICPLVTAVIKCGFK